VIAGFSPNPDQSSGAFGNGETKLVATKIKITAKRDTKDSIFEQRLITFTNGLIAKATTMNITGKSSAKRSFCVDLSLMSATSIKMFNPITVG
jgi:hypothetical protein